MYMTEFCTARFILLSILAAMVAVTAACQARPPADRVRVSGQVEATDVQVNELLQQLVYNKCGVRSFSEKDPSLEDVFMMVTKGLVT